MSFPEKLSKLLENRKQLGIFRQLEINYGLIDFYSNDYLGFARRQLSSSAISSQSQTNGSTGSRLISGNSKEAEALEHRAAEFHLGDRALLFNSGYDANLGLLSSVPQKNDLVIIDELSHASIYDGLRLSYAKHYKFRHNDVEHLKELIKRHEKDVEQIYIVVESVYSMDGDSAPLKAIANLCNTKIHLIVDEAHACGIFGEKGRGLCVEQEITDRCFARVITYGKAFGCHGAVVLGSEALRNFLVNFARSFIYTTALPPHSVAQIAEVYELMKNTDAISGLRKNIDQFISLTKGCANLIQSTSAIHCFVSGSNELVEKQAEWLRANGIMVKAIKSPTVKAGSERLRICLHSFNTKEEINQLVKCMSDSGIMKF